MNEAKIYKDKIENVYVDFSQDTIFLSLFDKAIDLDTKKNDKAYDRILKDVIELDLSKVKALVDLM